MQMTSVLDSFRELCNSPVAWGILALATVRAAWSLVSFLTCPLVHRQAAIAAMDAERDRRAVESLHVNSPRFLVTMLTGMALTIGGLYALARPDAGPLALAAILLGSFLLIVEPSRLGVEENTRRASASRLQDSDAQAFAQERLRASHIERIAMEIGMVALLAAVILFY